MTARRKSGRRALCHYCHRPGNTRDHIVPRSRAVGLCAPSSSITNIVRACADCNGRKSDFRSDCYCRTCVLAWETFGPPGWRDIPVVELVRPAFPAVAR